MMSRWRWSRACEESPKKKESEKPTLCVLRRVLYPLNQWRTIQAVWGSTEKRGWKKKGRKRNIIGGKEGRKWRHTGSINWSWTGRRLWSTTREQTRRLHTIQLSKMSPRNCLCLCWDNYCKVSPADFMSTAFAPESVCVHAMDQWTVFFKYSFHFSIFMFILNADCLSYSYSGAHL